MPFLWLLWLQGLALLPPPTLYITDVNEPHSKIRQKEKKIRRLIVFYRLRGSGSKWFWGRSHGFHEETERWSVVANRVLEELMRGGEGRGIKNILQSFMVGSGKLYRDSTKIRQPPRPPAINDGGPLCTSKWFLKCQILNDNFDICMTHFFFLMVISSLEL